MTGLLLAAFAARAASTAPEAAEPAPRAPLSLGLGLDLGVDLPGGHDGTAAGLGPGLSIPLRVPLAEGAALRVGLGAFGLVGSDRVEWTEDTVDWYSDDHRSIYGVLDLSAGPEIALAPRRAVDPYLGVAAGLRLVGGWHTFEGGTASLREAGQAATTRDTLQLVPGIGGDVGVRLKSPAAGVRGVAVEVEAGYSVSFLPEAPLGEVPTAFGASRTAFALDRARFGLGVSFPLV